MFCISVGTYHFPQWNTSAVLLTSKKPKIQKSGSQRGMISAGLCGTLCFLQWINLNRTLNSTSISHLQTLSWEKKGTVDMLHATFRAKDRKLQRQMLNSERQRRKQLFKYIQLNCYKAVVILPFPGDVWTYFWVSHLETGCYQQLIGRNQASY